MSDNFRFDVSSEGPGHLRIVLQLALDGAPGNKVTHYIRDENGKLPRLILLWNVAGKGTPLPAPARIDELAPLVEGWLGDVSYGDEPDHDGDNGKGWRIYNEAWGHVADNHYGVCGIEPCWMMYGK